MNNSTLLRRVKDAIARNCERNVAGVPAGAPKFVEPTSDTWVRQHRTYHPKGYYVVFCAHDRPYIVPCVRCKRSVKEAQANLAKLL